MYFSKGIAKPKKQRTLAEIDYLYDTTNHLYEWVDSLQVYKPYVDVDYWINNPDITESEVSEQTETLINKARSSLCEVLNNPDLKFVIETSNGFQDKVYAKGKTYNYKISIHIVVLGYKIQGLYFKSLLEKHELLEGQKHNLFDPSVYKTKNMKFRVAGFKKEHSERKSIIRSGTIPDFLISNITNEILIEGEIIPVSIDPVVVSPTNPQSPTTPPPNPGEFKTESNLLKLIGPVTTYNDWFKITMILKAINPNLYYIWDEWCKLSDNYDSNKNLEIWNKLKKYNYTIKSLHFLAQFKNIKEYSKQYLYADCLNFCNNPDHKTGANLFLKITEGHIICTDMELGDCYIFDVDKTIWINRKLTSFILYISDRLLDIYNPFISKLKFDLEEIKKTGNDNKIKIQEELLKNAVKLQKRLGDAPYIKNLISFIKSSETNFNPSFRDLLTSKKHLLGVKNGVVDLKTGILRTRQYDDYLTDILDIDYNEDADTSLWESFITELFTHKLVKNTKEVVRYIQKVFGYMITKETTEQVMILLNGVGSNGKTLLTNCISNVFNKLTLTVDDTLFDSSIKKQSAHTATPAKAILFNKSIGIVSEMSDTIEIDKVFKELVDKNSRISGRELNKNLIEFEITTKFLVTTNHIPKFKCEPAIIRRLLIMTLYNKFVTESNMEEDTKLIDKHLEEKLLENKEGILKWFVIGSGRYYNEGGILNIPDDLEQAKNAVVAENDWKASLQITKDKSDKIKMDDLYAHIKMSCNQVISNKEIKKQLEEMGAVFYRHARERGYRYIKSSVIGDCEEDETENLGGWDEY